MGYPAVGKWRAVRLARATSESMTGTSTSTPTTVASAAPDCVRVGGDADLDTCDLGSAVWTAGVR